MKPVETKRAIQAALAAFAGQPLTAAATGLFESLGYKSDKRLPLKPNTPDSFLATFGQGRKLNADHALLSEWQSVDFLFQLTDDEVRAAAAGTQQFLFDSKGKYNGAAMESYLFFAIALKKPQYTRTELSGITRAVNRLFSMPALLLFQHGDTLTLAVINRRLHKREESKDVLEKVTLIKDIRFANPHRAHVEILFDLSFDTLREGHDFNNFVTLHAAWQKTLDSSELNKRFFQEIANWYFWALNHIEFPKDAPKEADGHDHISVIRLITRLIFCWFVKEKGLIPDALFDQRKLAQTLEGFAPEKSSDKDSVFYRAILQNLFFATLNTEMDKRAWTKEEQNFMAHSLYRFRECFSQPGTALDLFKNIPFLNGGLFECLDKDLGEKANPRYQRVDGFSRRPDSQPTVPDFLFFGPDREVDLSADYGDDKFKRVTVRGLIHTFEHYKFTITENTPIEEEIALDPELSGKVFENLLAAYNPETNATARKQTGSFFTPREIVNYMVDETLIAYLQTKLEAAHPSAKDVEARLRHLFAYNAEHHQFTPQEVDTLIAAIDHLKSIDPAVGSGAFPMGILHKLVFILGKLDPRNEKWKERQVGRVREAMAAAEKIEDATVQEHTLRELEQQIAGINEAFEHNELDYGRKLYLIENCIYGVDIQPIAVQIAKMRFFISLIVDQKIDDTRQNRGVRPLPNLETKFVAANTLLGINRPGQQMLRNRDIETKEAELRRVRERHFMARTPASKSKCRDQDAKLRAEIAALLKSDGWDTATARKLASWDPYDQNSSADFFDAEWMFGLTDGFDVAIGNPPYLDSENMTNTNPELRALIQASYSFTKGNWDIYIAFYEKAFQLANSEGIASFITPNKWISKPFGDEMRLQTTHKIRSILKAGRDVFESANVDAIVTVFGNRPQPLLRICDIVNSEIVLKRTIEKSALKAPYAYDWLFSDFVDLFAKIEAQPAKLSHHGTCENACATSDAYKLQEFIQEESNARGQGDYLRIINTGTIGKYVSKWGQREMVYLGQKYLKPVINKRRFLAAFQNSYGRKSVKPKLIVKGLNLLDACVDLDGTVIPGKTTLMITSETEESLKCLLAIINSTVAFFYLKEKYPASSYNQGTTFTKEMINDLPVPKLTDVRSTRLTSLVDRFLVAKEKNANADTSTLAREIDQQVNALYGLTPTEVTTIERSLKAK